ncbi:response regulator [Cohnella herbarum]|uniref:Response regulator n=1 Tax=Cohnella herbarum TaxID=2728023 RepID=A0A7Z2ZNT9_9BACL|nr:response regulator [Cohnella herbarum]QJD86796.1 response regulator [Cohnella herbarum]
MYRLLLIDNEPFIVDGLYDLFLELDSLELVVLKAYSASEALTLLSAHKIDIVIADIRMPGMSGLELQQLIRKQWPFCKTIFLTGYNDFSYVQTAMRHGGLDYVLKTEGDERILEAFHSAIAALQEEWEKEHLMGEARKELHLAKPLLQKEYLLSLLNGERLHNEGIQLRFAELGISLNTAVPALIVVGRVDEWPGDYSLADRELLTFAIHNIAQEYFSNCPFAAISYDRTKFIWLIQPQDADEVNGSAFVQRVHETLDSVQTASRGVLNIPVSFVTHSSLGSWSELPSVFNRLIRLLGRGLGLGRESLLIDIPTAEKTSGPATKGACSIGDNANIASQRRTIPLLESYLEGGDAREFASLCSGMLQSAVHDPLHYTEMYYSIATMILSYLNRLEATQDLLERQDFDGLMRIDDHPDWEAAAHYFESVVALLFAKRHDEREEKSHSIVTRLNLYIKEHLHEDLSLTKLSEVANLSASYLSRLYKQTTGHGLAEYIAEKRIDKANSLLTETVLKIHEIAREVGLEHNYFIKMFKKYTHMTPQEYRELKVRD